MKYTPPHIMPSLYHTFLSEIQNIIQKNNNKIEPSSYSVSHLWQYTVHLFSEHKDLIESLISIWYTPDNIFLRETLSGKYPIIQMHETAKFEESYYSGKSDLIPSVTFVRETQWEAIIIPIVRIEFWSSELAGID